MKYERSGIALAVFFILMNLWVTLFCGPRIWAAWGGMPWARLGILVLAGAGAFTLLDIWARSLYLLALQRQQAEVGHTDWPAPAPVGQVEDADV